MKKVLFNWSGGKDSSLCLHKLLASGDYEVSRLVTTINQEKRRISMHGVREELLELQVNLIGLPLHKILLPGQVSMEEYDRLMGKALEKFREQGIRCSVFGDIFLEDLRTYREQRLAKAGIEALFPLWKQPTEKLAQEFIASGFKAVVVCTDADKLDQSFAGREYNHHFLKDLPPDVDPCGEHGEFHTFVYDGPVFRNPVPFKYGEIVQRKYIISSQDQDDHQQDFENKAVKSTFSFWFCDLVVDI